MPKTILHLDDESDIRELLAAYLGGRGYRIISTATPTDALKVLQTQPADLVILDLQLNEADGLESVDRIRAVLPDVPIILLTGVLVDPRVADQTLGKKVSAYLEKTSPLSRVLAEVQRFIGT